MKSTALRLALCLVLAHFGSSNPAAAQECPGTPTVHAFGLGTPGSLGVAQLVTYGAPIESFPFRLELRGALPGVEGFFIVGTSIEPVPLPAYGAILYPAGDELRAIPLTTDTSGKAALIDESPTSTALCGLDIIVQAAVFDPGAQGGVAFSAGMHVAFGAASAATPLLASIDSPTASSSIIVQGTGVQEGDVVQITGGKSVVETLIGDDGSFSASVPLSDDTVHMLFVQELYPGNIAGPPGTLTVVQDSSPPLVAIDFPSEGAVLGTSTTNVTGTLSDKLSGFLGLTVNVNGQPATVNVGVGTNGSFDLPTLDLGAGGPVEIVVQATDAVGNVSFASRTVVYQPPTGGVLEVLSGDDQKGVVGTELAEPLVVRALSTGGSPIIGKPISFEVVQSDGTLSAPAGPHGVRKLSVLTDSLGHASANWSLGSDAGMGNNRVGVAWDISPVSTYFCASAMPDLQTLKINVGTGNDQAFQAGSAAPELLNAWVNDGQNGVAGLEVLFEVAQGQGLLEVPDGLRSRTLAVQTDLTGHARVRYIGSDLAEVAHVSATLVDGGGLPATFMLRTVKPDLHGTRLSGVVRDNSVQPIGGAIVHLVFEDGQSFDSSTDVSGHFHFDQIESGGPAMVVVEGATAFTLGGVPIDPSKLLFPKLAQEAFVVEQAANPLVRPILLPRLDPASFVTFDGTADVKLTMAGVEGLSVSVPMDTVILDPDGRLVSQSNPIELSISPVHVDDIPMPLPDGASAPLAWTVQPGGSTFDPPLSIELPNMVGLKPGAVTYILVFDHDTSRFEIVAPATVTSDGSLIASKPGTGISEAGWGGVSPPFANTGAVTNECPPGNGEKCEDCSSNPQIQLLEAEGDALLAQAQQKMSDAHTKALLAELLSGGSCALGLAAMAGGTILAIVTCLGSGSALCIPSLVVLLVGSIATLAGCFSLYLTGIDNIHLARSLYAEADVLGSAAADKYHAKDALCLKLKLDDAKQEAAQKLLDAIDAAQEALDAIELKLQDLIQKNQAATDTLQEWKQTLEDFLDGDSPIANAPDGEIPQEIIDFWDNEVLPILNDYFAASDTLDEDIGNSTAAGMGALSALDVLESVLKNEACAVESGGQFAAIDVFGEFTVSNVPTGGPTRVTVTCEGAPETFYAQSDYFLVVNQGSVTVGPLAFSTVPPVSMVSLVATADAPTLNAIGQTAAIETNATFSDGSHTSVVGLADGLIYQSSAPQVVSVDGDGIAMAQSSGIAYVTAIKDGAASSVKLVVAPGDPLTVVQGLVVDALMQPVAGADVTTTAGFATTSVGNGAFSISGHTTTKGAVDVHAFLSIGAQNFLGFALGNALVPGGVTEIGWLVVDVDSDGDQLPDWYEQQLYGTDPALADTDGDGLSDGTEVFVFGTNPTLADTDGDGFDDNLEVTLGSDPVAFDLATALAGEVGLPGGLPAAGAELGVLGVPTSLYEAVAGRDGNFVFDEPWPTGLSPVVLQGFVTVPGKGTFNGISEPTPTISGGTTFVGPFELHPGASGPLYPGAQYSPGLGTYSVAVSDLDLDGLADLAVANHQSGVSVLLNQGGGSFGAAQTHPAGSSPFSVAISDLDQDGWPDLAVANNGGTVSLLFGLGGGEFTSAYTLPVGVGPFAIAISDLNQDGWPDLVVANSVSNDVSVLLAQGGGNFYPALSFDVGVAPKALAISDLNQDGIPDLAVANDGSANVSVLLGTGDGTFLPADNCAAGVNPQSVAIADFNQDFVPDIAVANFGTTSVSVLLGKGDGMFFPAVTSSGGLSPRALAAADLDHDGDQDLAVTNTGANGVSVLLGKGDGTFPTSKVKVYPADNFPISVAIADLTGDSVLDLIVANLTSNNLSELIGTGDGTFVTAPLVAAGTSPRSVALADVNQDGLEDMAVANFGSSNVSVLLAQGMGGTFAPAQNLPTGASSISVAIGDLNLDTLPDLAVANQGVSSNVSILLGLGDGNFSPSSPVLAGVGPTSVAISDLSLDGLPDLAVANLFSSDVSVLLGEVGGTLASAQNYPAGITPQAVVIADLNQDGLPDLATAGSNNVSLLFGMGAGAFSGPQVIPAGASAVSLASADLNADGLQDLAVANFGSSNVSVLLGLGAGSFSAAMNNAVGILPRSVAISDLDLDGVPDIAVANNGSKNMSVLLGYGDGTFSAPQAYTAYAGPFSLAISDLDLDGQPDVALANSDSNVVSILLHQ